MRHVSFVVAVGLELACGSAGPAGPPGDPGTKGDKGDPGGAGAMAISGIEPGFGLLAREVDVAISGSGTAFDASTTVTLGAGANVTKTTVVSSALVVAHVSIDATAAIGPRDVTVKTTGAADLVGKAGFSVKPSMDAFAGAAGYAQQGTLALVKVHDNDPNNAFDQNSFVYYLAETTRLFGIRGDATSIPYFPVLGLDATDAEMFVLFDPLAPASGQLVGANLDPFDGTTATTKFYSDPSTLPVAARTPSALPSTGGTTEAIAQPYGTLFYSVKTNGPAIVDFATTPGTGSQIDQFMWTYPASGKYVDLLTQLNSCVTLPAAGATTFYGVIIDYLLRGGPSITATTSARVTPATLNTESTSAHGTIGTAQSITPANLPTPAIITGSLGTTSETDVYALGSPGGTAGQAIEIALTSSTGDAVASLVTSASTLFSVSPQAPAHTTSDAEIEGVGTFYVSVTTRTGAPAAAGSYTISVRVVDETP
jgi:hypothetical protein